MVDDDGAVIAVNTDDELRARLASLSAFQLELLIHAFKFPAARKITYSTCSIHAEENEFVVQNALQSAIAKERGWRILKRDEQVSGMKNWPVRGSLEACGGNELLAESCIRANKGDEHGTMGFFLAGFVRDQGPTPNLEARFSRDESGHIVRDLLGFPVMAQPDEFPGGVHADQDFVANGAPGGGLEVDEVEWDGFGDDGDLATQDQVESATEPLPQKKQKHSYSAGKRRPELIPKGKKRGKSRGT